MLTASSRRGRPRKQGVPRDKRGEIAWGYDRERPEDVKRVALEARLRQSWGVHKWKLEKAKADGNDKAYKAALKAMDDDYRGYALGRLLIAGRADEALGITEEQHDAGAWFCKLLALMARKVWDAPSMTPRSIAADMTAGGISHHPEDSLEYINDLKRRFRDVEGYLSRVPGDGESVRWALIRVLREDQDIDPREVGALRLGLNAINLARGA